MTGWWLQGSVCCPFLTETHNSSVAGGTLLFLKVKIEFSEVMGVPQIIQTLNHPSI